MYDIEMQYDKLQTKIAMVQGRSCDKYDYLIAVFCGVAAGLIDSLFVGKPNMTGSSEVKNSVLGSWTDNQTQKMVDKFADFQMKKDYKIYDDLRNKGYKGQELRNLLRENGIPENLRKNGYATFKDKITYLESKYPVCYDNSVDAINNLTPYNHHLKSLSHCPDILGLCCSIVDQFTYTTTVFQAGKLVSIVPTKRGMELRGTTLISKLYCAVCNWFGHLFSDICGSHSAKGRGMGISIPFFEVFQFCDFGNIEINEGDKLTVAELSVKVFEHGYDARFGAAMAIPVLLEDLLIRFLWSVKQHFYHKNPWKECIPDNKHPDLRLMLIVGNGALCFVDGADALIRSKGNILEFVLHLNLIAWMKLCISIFKEFMIRFDFTYEDLRIQFEYLNHQLDIYTEKLKTINYEQYEQEIAELDNIADFLMLEDLDFASNAMSSYIKEKKMETTFSDFELFMQTMGNSDKKIKF